MKKCALCDCKITDVTNLYRITISEKIPYTTDSVALKVYDGVCRSCKIKVNNTLKGMRKEWSHKDDKARNNSKAK